jgi:hypothetical protein
MATFAYNAGAELFLLSNRWSRERPVAYRQFARAADAIRFGICQLYESADYPFTQRAQVQD